MRLVVVNNYKDPKKREEVQQNLSRSAGQKVDVVNYDQRDLALQVLAQDPDLLFLSGSGHLLTRPGTQEKFRPEMDLIRKANFPIVGICYGHQLIGTSFGAKMADLGKMVRGFEQVEVLDHHPIFDGLPPSIQVAESHRQVLDMVPDGFVRLATSETSQIEAMFHKTRPLYSFQFHPERTDDARPHGRKIIQNLLKLVRS